ncbi:hypothetical protein [Nonomuraea sp. NPDC049480]|uniref:hypothetical protein n=1 Tax=Nonomuraea sp. NPDC049480 TaxID=3364353 RepID=UPI003788F7D8
MDAVEQVRVTAGEDTAPEPDVDGNVQEVQPAQRRRRRQHHLQPSRVPAEEPAPVYSTEESGRARDFPEGRTWALGGQIPITQLLGKGSP